jgi:dinuclear metal center YbgI/SA1388 family protein
MLSPMIAFAPLLQHCNDSLQPERFKDYCPNGLQVQGQRPIKKIVSGVTASLALIEAAIARDADAILVHHGLFWRGDSGAVTGWLRERLHRLLSHDVHLLAYHLPLDAQPALGNNAQLGRVLGLLKPTCNNGNGNDNDWAVDSSQCTRFGDQNLGLMLNLPEDKAFEDLNALAEHAQRQLGRPPIAVVDGASVPHKQPLRRIAWCTGGAQSYFEDAIRAGAQVFITGEISEPQAHYAREMGVAYLAFGHHATERYGVQAVGQDAARQLGLVHEFIDIDNPA